MAKVVPGARVQHDLRKVLLVRNALVLARPEVVIAGAAAKFDATTGVCTDERTRKFGADQMTSFEGWIAGAKRLREGY